MLSLILSWLFRIAFVIVLITGTAQVIVQIIQHPIEYNKSEKGVSTLGKPGMFFTANRTNSNERPAPDTIIHFTIKRAPTFENAGGGSILLNDNFRNRHHWQDSMIDISRKRGDSIIMDTMANLLLNRGLYEEFPSDQKTGILFNQSQKDLDDGRMVMEKTTVDSTGKVLSVISSDTFANAKAAMLFGITGKKNVKLSQEGFGMQETLRIMPSTTAQHTWFIFYDAVIAACVVLLMLTLANLFRNFYKKNYFTVANVKQVRNAGWLLLIPQLLKFANYWFFLFKIHPVKVETTAEQFNPIKELAYYEPLSGLDWSYIFLGLGLIILSYIFRRGLKINETFSLTI